MTLETKNSLSDLIKERILIRIFLIKAACKKVRTYPLERGRETRKRFLCPIAKPNQTDQIHGQTIDSK